MSGRTPLDIIGTVIVSLIFISIVTGVGIVGGEPDLKLVGCYDGDTCEFNNYDRPIRLAYIDAPEMGGPCHEAAMWSRNAVLMKLKAADEITITIVDRGHYGRPIAEIEVDGASVSAWMLNHDFAVPYGEPTCRR